MATDNDKIYVQDSDKIYVPDNDTTTNNLGDGFDDDGTVTIGNTTFTEEEIEQANKPQPNVILSTADVNNNIASSYRDTERVNPRSNESPDSTDSNSGGIISGGAKGVSQS